MNTGNYNLFNSDLEKGQTLPPRKDNNEISNDRGGTTLPPKK